jgi:hypothetical protein
MTGRTTHHLVVVDREEKPTFPSPEEEEELRNGSLVSVASFSIVC